jgi:tetratricopeptide (TPR) repeat protein
LRFEDSDEARNLLRQAQSKLKVDEDRAYADATDRAARAMREGRWGDALEAYQGALALRKTGEAQDGVAAANKKLQQQAQYRQMLDAANVAIGKGDYKTAWQWITAATGLFPDAPEAKALSLQLGPTVIVRAEVGGKEYSGAKVMLDGKPVKGATPVGLRLRKGDEQEIEVTVPSQGGKSYLPEKRTVRPSQDGLQELVVQVKEVKLPTKTPEQIAREKKYGEAMQSANDAVAELDYRKAWLRINEAMTADPAGQEAKDLAARLGPTLGVKALLEGKEYAGAQVSINGQVQGQATPASFRLKKGQAYKVSVTIPAKGGKTYSADEMAFKADENEYKEFSANISEVKGPTVPETTPTSRPEVAPLPKPRPTPATSPTPRAPATLPEVAPTSKPVVTPAPKLPVETPADKANKKKYETALEAANNAIDKKDYKSAWQQIDLALSIVPDGQEARTLAQTLGPTLTVKALLNDTEYPGARVTLNGEPQKDTTPSAFKLKPGETCKIEVTIVKRGKSYTTDTKTITPDKTGNTEFAAVIKEVK